MGHLLTLFDLTGYAVHLLEKIFHKQPFATACVEVDLSDFPWRHVWQIRYQCDKVSSRLGVALPS
jgi:hypothetical protein